MTTIMTDWKIREIFDAVNVMYSKFYKTFGNCKGFFTSQRESCILDIFPKEKQKFWNYNLQTVALYDMEVYLGKDRIRATADMTAIHATVKQLSRKVKECGHKFYMDNNYSSSDLYSDLTEEKINY
jgi:hypothetical protein